jgi:hypothetical protein
MKKHLVRFRRLWWLLPACLSGFLLAFAPAEHARAEEIACTGTDLVGQLAEKDPALLRKIKDEAAAIPNGKGFSGASRRTELLHPTCSAQCI